MKPNEPIRVAISGAAGRIGYSLVFRVAAGGLFGPEQPVELRLLELPSAFPRLEACAMELKDCAYPLLADLKIGTDSREVFQGADWVILLGGKPFSTDLPNRLDLLRANAPTMVEQGRAINQAAPTARVLVVVQPCKKVRGTTPAGAVAQAILGTIRSITTPTPFDRWFAAGVVSNGSYGVPRGLVFGFPLFTTDGKNWSIVEGLYVDEVTRARIAANVAELEHEATVVSHLVGAL